MYKVLKASICVNLKNTKSPKCVSHVDMFKFPSILIIPPLNASTGEHIMDTDQGPVRNVDSAIH